MSGCLNVMLMDRSRPRLRG